MSSPTRWLLVPALLAGWLGLVGVASPQGAPPPPIKDRGEFFSREAGEKANKQIQEIYRKYKRDLVIETYPGVPAGKEDRLKTPEDRDRFFLEWARERAGRVKVADAEQRREVLKYHTAAEKFWQGLVERANAE
jgi:hypothetical protein